MLLYVFFPVSAPVFLAGNRAIRDSSDGFGLLSLFII